MPTTYNGVGTHYYGKSNVETRLAACNSCGRQQGLVSYDTRLWFVVLFIPVIPLGRKRIIDQCPTCKRHYVIDADKWETQKQLGISGAMDTFETNPTPEAAMQLHQTMLNFHQSAQAAEFRRTMVEKFGENAHVHAYLGTALTNAGQGGEAVGHYARALALRPDLPEARIGVARSAIAAGERDRARGLLDFLEKPGAEQLYSLEPLEVLADAYRKAGQHATALELYVCLLRALPTVGQMSNFRKKVRISEKALRAPNSILPKRQWSWRNLLGGGGGGRSHGRSLAYLGIVLLLVGAGFIVANEYYREHRQIYVVSATDGAATVQIDGKGVTHTLQLAAPRAGANEAAPRIDHVEVPEGHYHVKIGGNAAEEFDLEVRTDFWSRWGGDPIWLINVGGAALLLEQRVTYRQNPPPASYTLHFGKTQEFLPQITHPFQTLPASVQLKSGEQRVLTELQPANGAPMDWVQRLAAGQRSGEAADLAEWTAQRRPDDEMAVGGFVALGASRRAHVEAVLKAGLARRPVQVAWHRQYQNFVRQDVRNQDGLVAEYDAMLRAEPENASLLYLRGRITADGTPWIERAHRLDPASPYPAFALGYERAAQGRWEEARPLLESAAELMPAHVQFATMFWECRLALGEWVALEAEARTEVNRRPLAIDGVERLIEVLAAQDRKPEAMAVASDFTRASQRFTSAEAKTAQDAVWRYALYATGDFAGLQKRSLSDRTPEGRKYLFEALVEEGHVADAVKIFPLEGKEVSDPYHYLLISLAWNQLGASAEASAWLARGIDLLARGDATARLAAEALRGATAPSADQLRTVRVPIEDRGILLAVLAAQHAESRDALMAGARKFLTQRVYPYHFLDRLTAPGKR